MKPLLYGIVIALCTAAYDAPAQDNAESPRQTKMVRKDKKKVSAEDSGLANNTPTKEKKKATADQKKESAVVASALRKLKYSGSKPNMKAQVYIFLHSASYCPPCRAEMPEFVKEYRNMKDAGVELIVFSHDDNEANTKAWLKSEKAKFPVVMLSSNKPDTLKKLPGYHEVNGIPHATIVDASGNELADGHGVIVKSWEKYVPKADTPEE